MCGIGAIWGDASGKQETLRTMLSTISHRGNSLYEVLEAGKCALGANRLEITDRMHGRQPKSSENNSVFAVFNGEIFNHQALKNQLERIGHTFKSDCDTETLVHLYETFGEKMVEQIDSEMFAFVLYDLASNSLFAARDRWGVKPLYWAKDDQGNFYFGSEIKELSCIQQISTINNFPPGHYFENGKFVRYYRLSAKKNEKIEEERAAQILRCLIDEAVKKRVSTDLPIGVFLSGGLDSTSILATAMKYHRKITAIIVGNNKSEDAKFARRYCVENKVNYFLIRPPTEKEMFASVAKIIKITESFEPNVVRQSAISYYIANAAKKLGIRIVLCGEGADELFLGYPEFSVLGRKKIADAQRNFLKSLHRTQFQRVDRTSMHFTLEVRVPFFDQKIVELASSLPAKMKIKAHDGIKIEKYILRKAMSDRLPGYICNRKKVVLSEGAGYKGNQPGGLFEELASAQISDEEFEKMLREYPDWNIRTREEAFYFRIFEGLGYCKARFNMKRVIANRTLSIHRNIGDNLADRILNKISSKKFCRFGIKQRERMSALISEAVKRKSPIEFFMLWGVWKKDSVDVADEAALEILDNMLSGIIDIYPTGFRLTIVLADTHAELNLMDKMKIYAYDSYLGSFERFA
ncbi:MAG: hypothetical protein EPN86_04740, partial [Nanoarchaeota archaeon]